ncbi:MAG: tagatose 1,6-diphosphate aldolase, partial [Rhodospirillales bacterium]|nr:tagatose 1,6-diphosphate aldolase [Rhodospirillales bacterium]
MAELTAGKLWGIRRLADENGRFKMTAVDQRPPIKNYIKERRKVDEAGYDDVAAVKIILARELAPYSSAVLLDPHVAYPQAIEYVSPSKGVIATLEDSLFEETPQGRKSAEIDNWSVEKIKRSGADAVKVLAWYRPDAAEEIRAFQQDYVRKIGDDCKRYDIPFVFELLVYPLPGEDNQTTDYIEHKDK